MTQRFYRLIDKSFEYCYYIETSANLSESELKMLGWLIAETFEPEKFGRKSFFCNGDGKMIEIGPRLNFETAFSTNAVAICHSCGLAKVNRLERSRRYLISPDTDYPEFINRNHDRMTECVYREPLEDFEIGIKPEEVYLIPLIKTGEGEAGEFIYSYNHGQGADALRNFNIKLGLGMDEWDIDFYYNLFGYCLRDG